MKKITETILVLAILLLTASVCWGQALTFQTGDVFAGIGNGQIQWYRPTPTEGGVVYTLLTTLIIPSTNTFDTGMAFDAAGNLYATDFSVGEVSKFDIHGNSSLFASDFGAVSPESVVFDNAGNVFVGDANGFSTDGGGRQATIWKLGPSGPLLASFTVAAEQRGADWVDLAADQKTIFYTSEGTSIKRFDTSTNTQLPDFVSNLPGSNAFALKILPSGNVLVADSDRAVQLDTLGNIIHTYQPPGSPAGLFSLNLDPDGKHFWVGDSFTGTIWQIRIADVGTVVDQTISTGVVPVSDTTSGLFGVAVFHEITSSNSTNLQFNPSTTPETQIATVGNPSDPAAQSLALTLASVTNAINVSVTFFYEATDLSTGTHGVGIADGVCEANATEDQDFDCRLAANFTYPSQTLLPGDRLVPHIIPSHNNLGVWVRVTATLVSNGQPAVAGTDYTGPVDWYYAWNSNPLLVGSNPEYPPGWNSQNPQMYDRPGENTDSAYTKNITTFSKLICNPTCVGTADPGSGGRTPTLNDIVVGAPPNPPAGTPQDTVELIVPVPAISPFPYASRAPMLVAFELENESKELSDPTALTPPHSVNVATFLNGVDIPVQYPKGFPTTFTYSPFLKKYFIFLSSAPYKADGTVYTLQIDSDLFPQPVTANFVVKKFQF